MAHLDAYLAVTSVTIRFRKESLDRGLGLFAPARHVGTDLWAETISQSRLFY